MRIRICAKTSGFGSDTTFGRSSAIDRAYPFSNSIERSRDDSFYIAAGYAKEQRMLPCHRTNEQRHVIARIARNGPALRQTTRQLGSNARAGDCIVDRRQGQEIIGEIAQVGIRKPLIGTFDGHRGTNATSRLVFGRFEQSNDLRLGVVQSGRRMRRQVRRINDLRQWGTRITENGRDKHIAAGEKFGGIEFPEIGDVHERRMTGYACGRREISTTHRRVILDGGHGHFTVLKCWGSHGSGNVEWRLIWRRHSVDGSRAPQIQDDGVDVRGRESRNEEVGHDGKHGRSIGPNAFGHHILDFVVRTIGKTCRVIRDVWRGNTSDIRIHGIDIDETIVSAHVLGIVRHTHGVFRSMALTTRAKVLDDIFTSFDGWFFRRRRRGRGFVTTTRDEKERNEREEKTFHWEILVLGWHRRRSKDVVAKGCTT